MKLTEFKISSDMTDAYKFLQSAKEFLDGAEVLLDHPHKTIRAFTLLSGHALECMLKAYLCYADKNITLANLKSFFGHDLLKLVDKSTELGLKFPDSKQNWLHGLDKIYDKPFELRYLSSAGGQFPNPHIMFNDLKIIFNILKELIKK